MDRRNFFKKTAIGSAGLMLGSEMFFTGNAFSAGEFASSSGVRGIAPIAMMEDTQVLLLRSAGAKLGVIKNAIVTDLHSRPAAPANKSRLASLLPVNDKRLPALFEALRKDPEQRNYTEKLSLALGWVSNNASYRHFSPLFDKSTTAEESYEIQLYTDAVVVRDLMNNDTEALKSNELSLFFNEILPRTITRIHTLIPAEDGANWVNRISEWRRYNKDYLHSLAEVILDPDREKYTKYIVSKNFYNPGDDLIKISRKLQNTEDVNSSEILTALDSENQSLYSRGVVESYRNTLAAADYMDGKITLAELEAYLLNE
jgi:hypothetical protein